MREIDNSNVVILDNNIVYALSYASSSDDDHIILFGLLGIRLVNERVVKKNTIFDSKYCSCKILSHVYSCLKL
jgi:hypothetical protein